jgi:Fur family zinc uptake transcriptional regulator
MSSHSPHLAHHPDLKKNQKLVYDALHAARSPLSAYAILDLLREHGFRAPLQVYRALEKLMEFGLVHKLESLNAFVACSHDECEASEPAAFMICEECESVSELGDSKLTTHLSKLANTQNFALKHTTVELHGRCKNCA